MPLTRWFLAMHLLTQAKNNVSALELKRHLGVRYKTAWLMKHKLLQVMCEREESRQLVGVLRSTTLTSAGSRPGEKGAEVRRTWCPSLPPCKPPTRAIPC